MRDTKRCEGCGKTFKRGKWDLGRKWAERRACGRSCGSTLSHRPPTLLTVGTETRRCPYCLAIYRGDACPNGHRREGVA